MGKLINVKNSYPIHSVSYYLQTTHPFGQNNTLSWILVSIPDIFSSLRYSALKFVYKVNGKT